VQVTSNGDSHAAGRARLRLKFAAIGYDNARHGIDASPELNRAALLKLASAAWEFYEVLNPGRVGWDDVLATLEGGEIVDLALAAISYDNSRHGIDADVGLIRAALEFLCSAAIAYCESVPRHSRPHHATPALGEGAR